jgi:DMSO/TMAO reductase YedYZ molybdopterin-dependent catalytic subunit
MNPRLSRRDLLRGSVALAAAALSHFPLSRFGFADTDEGGQVLPFLEPLPPKGGRGLKWDDLQDWLTPAEQVFAVSHYGTPNVDVEKWRLEIAGLVKKPAALSLADLKARKSQEVIATLECSGNGASPTFSSAIGNLRWKGTALAPLLRECGLEKRGIEVVFVAADQKDEKLRDEKMHPVHFARSLAVPDALQDEVLLAYEMNGQPLTKEHGAPVRLIVPGWFGIAWVKWLTRIEVLDRRYMNRFMARDYVTVRGEEKDGHTTWRETSVGPIDVKSIVARAVRHKDGTVRLSGAAWTDGTPLAKVEVRIDDGAWQAAQLEKKKEDAPYGWTFWHYDWMNPKAGEHVVVSRAVDADGRVQPAAEDDAIKLKKTYWEANQQWPRKIKIPE